MRKQLGCPGRSPVEKMEQQTTRNTFAFISCLFALIIIHFALNLGIDIHNFIEKNTDGDIDTYILHTSQTVWTVKGVIGLITITFILSRQ